MRLLLFAFLQLLLFQPIHLQAPYITSAPIENRDVEWDGTYQFIMKTKVKEVFSSDILDFIEKHRKENEDVEVDYSAYSRIRILSKNKISASDFTPLTELYVFQSN
ncbi:MAG: hypothetical protein IAE67_00165 [Candidatus Competibacteraceae bacterium]|nr:hypothetical protein [Candidatus Competibacteraceae bacterium]